MTGVRGGAVAVPGAVPGAVPDAVLWDMDGTLVDTEPYWIEAERELAARHGTSWSDEQALQLVGNDLLVSGEMIRRGMGLPMTAAEVVDELLDGVVARVRRAVPWQPGARELLVALGGAGIPCALVTMSWRRFVAAVLEGFEDVPFRAVATGDEVAWGKPHPEPYLAAARMLGVDAARCLAIEDSETGARSAEAAGCTVLVVPHHVEVAPGPRRVFTRSLSGVGADDLRLVRP